MSSTISKRNAFNLILRCINSPEPYLIISSHIKPRKLLEKNYVSTVSSLNYASLLFKKLGYVIERYNNVTSLLCFDEQNINIYMAHMKMCIEENKNIDYKDQNNPLFIESSNFFYNSIYDLIYLIINNFTHREENDEDTLPLINQ